MVNDRRRGIWWHMRTIEIPLTPEPQIFSIQFGQKSYRLRFAYANVVDGGWFLDVFDDDNNPLVCGIPLITGLDLLAPYYYLEIPAMLILVNKTKPFQVPAFEELGTVARLYAVVP
jgi:hypothetical protein